MLVLLSTIGVGGGMFAGSESEELGEFGMMDAVKDPEKLAPERVDLRGKSEIFA
jgi:hypothetical protein